MDLVRSWACGEAPAVLQDKRSEEMNEQPCFCLQNRCCPFLCLWLTHTTDTPLTVPMRRAAASSIQGAVLVLGPADGLQAAAEGMPWYRECRGTGSQRRPRGRSAGGADARAGMCQRAPHPPPSCPLRCLELARDHFFTYCGLCSFPFLSKLIHSVCWSTTG